MAASERALRFGIIGAGNIGRVHAQTIAQLGGAAEVVAVTDAYLALAEQLAADFQVRKVYASAAELLADPDVDAVIICVPNKYHAQLAVEALQAGKHVVLEKPMAINATEAKKVVEAQRAADRLLMVPHQMRWEPVVEQVKEQVAKGALGRIYHAKTGWMRRKGIPGWGTWFTQKAESGGGPLIDIGVHMLDLALYLMGNPRPVAVTGATFAEFGPHRRGIGSWGRPNWEGTYDVEDLASAFIRMEDGSTLTLEVSWAAHTDLEQNGPFVHLLGSLGGASIHGARGKLLTEQFDRTVDLELSPGPDAPPERVAMFRHFLACVAAGREPVSNALTGYTNNLILDAIYESSRTGREVVLHWDV
ncbi:oxidoreductase [Alicyclobacillus cellulosilyticus]|uniref:Oxidoreductase n=1 Tax=Alicyclobacillus cellulosilyticus TaxID=1003997 RepID=A0A917NJG9_9BACL|nr:Gfo/Idh/MocA family oxidoreductase [Alicyclobacillus cellulosilyticus]GGJ02352.1 oxidoreductase [Alicyclobacillus cellulosilyticus]